MTRACANPGAVELRRDPEEMGLTLAFPAAVPQDVPREEAAGQVERIAPSDGELIQRVGSGDAGAFELLYRRDGPPRGWVPLGPARGAPVGRRARPKPLPDQNTHSAPS